MLITIDTQKGRAAAKLLYGCFNTIGIFGVKDMPENLLPNNVQRGSLDQILFLTLTVSIDYMRDADVLWNNSRKTHTDPDTNYLFNPKALSEINFQLIKRDLQKHHVALRPDKDANIWRTAGISFYKKWDGDPRNFLADCGWDAPKILNRLKTDYHIYNNHPRNDFPYLRGDKIGPLWLRMLRDNAGITQLKNLDQVPIPVDVHVARSTLCMGIVKGQYKGSMNRMYEYIRKAWFESVRELRVGEREMIALDIDESLWHLSKLGCTHRDTITGQCPVFTLCEAKTFCLPGKVFVGKGMVEVDT